MTDQPASLAEALALLQTRLPDIKKASKAQYGAYADLADVSRALLPVMGELGLSFTCAPTLIPNMRLMPFAITEPGEVPPPPGGVLVLEYVLRHAPSKESMVGFYPLPASGNSRALGSAITYGRRYCLCAITGAVADNDDDGQAASAQSPPAKRQRAAQPPRPVDELPRNADGQISRKYTTDEEKAAAGIMTKEQQAIHNALERDVKGTDSEGRTREPQDVQHAIGTAPDDLWYDQRAADAQYTPPPAVRQPRAAVSKAQQIVMHFERLGVDDKSVRLGYTARLAGLDTLRTTNDLTAQQGIDVEKKLASCRDADAFAKLMEASDA